ncbi:unnamed protein product, partial [Rotaria socialis]
HEQMDTRYNSHTASGRAAPSPYYHYPTVTNRSHHSNHGNFAWRLIIKDIEKMMISILFRLFTTFFSCSNVNLNFFMNTQGVYHQTPPVNMTPPPLPVYSRHHRQIDSRDQSHYSQQRYSSRSASDDYFISNYHDSNHLNGNMYDDDENDDGHIHVEDNSEVFNYPFDDISRCFVRMRTDFDDSS